MTQIERWQYYCQLSKIVRISLEKYGNWKHKLGNDKNTFPSQKRNLTDIGHCKKCKKNYNI